MQSRLSVLHELLSEARTNCVHTCCYCCCRPTSWIGYTFMLEPHSSNAVTAVLAWLPVCVAQLSDSSTGSTW